jgi:4-amino-4-deoxy-L-arabinose transferase-like glycosyltransferase
MSSLSEVPTKDTKSSLARTGFRRLGHLAWDYRFFALILALAALLRLADLGSVPSSVWYDEIYPATTALNQLQGYGPYYVANTPFAFTITRILFGEYQSILLLGTTTFSIRFFGAIYGVGVVALSFLLIRSLFSERVALLTALFVSVDPIAIESSRVFYGDQSTVALFFLLCATYLLYTGYRGSRHWLVRLCGGSAAMGLVVGYYFTDFGRLTGLVVLLVFAVAALPRTVGRLKERNVQNAVLGCTASFLFVAVLVQLLNPVTSAFTGTYQPSFYAGQYNLLLQGLSGISEFSQKYVTFFSPQFLFISGDPNPSQNTGYTGEFVWAEIPFVYLGLVLLALGLLRRSSPRFPIAILLFWTLSAPIETAAYSLNNYPDSFGVIFLIPGIEFAAAYGFLFLLGLVQQVAIRQQLARHVAVGPARFRSTPQMSGVKRIRAIGHTLLVISVVISVCYFVPAYFVWSPDSGVNNPETQWGMMYGYPQIASYITDNGLTNLPVYVSPHGLLGNNTADFNYWFYYTKTPQNYLNFYSDGRIKTVLPLAYPGYFSSSSEAMILTGLEADRSAIVAAGYNVSTIDTVTRPNGLPALFLLLANGLNRTAQNQLSTDLIYSSAPIVSPQEVNVPALANLTTRFTIGIYFNSTGINFTDSTQYALISSNSPSFSVGAWSQSYFTKSQAAGALTVEGTIYSDLGNWSAQGSWQRIAASANLGQNGSAFVAMTFNSGIVSLYLNDTIQAIGSVGYPIWPIPSELWIDLSGHAEIYSAMIWSVSLTPGQVGYAYSSTQV